MMKKSLKIKLAENISHTKKYGSEGGLLTPPPPKKNEGVGGGSGQNSFKSWKYSSVSFLFDFLFFLFVVLSPRLLPLHSCLPCHNLQDGA